MPQKDAKRMTRKERRNAPARYSPLDTPELRAEILRLLRSGVTMTEMCARDDMPPLATLFEMRRRHAEFGAAFDLAMAEHAEAMISDAMDQSVAVADAVADGEPVNAAHVGEPVRAGSDADKRARAAQFYLESSLKYAAAIAPQRFGSLLKVTDAQVGNGIQISITSYATKASEQGLEGVQDTGTEAPV